MLFQHSALRKAGVDIDFKRAAGMRMRNTWVPEVVDGAMILAQAALPQPMEELEAHYLAGGRVMDVAKSMLLLDKAGESWSWPDLAALDFADVPVLDLSTAFLNARKTHPELGFRELVDRYHEGEDVMTAIAEDAFIPRAQDDGWYVRVEYGPLSPENVRAYLDEGRISKDCQVLPPGGQQWRPLSELEDQLGV